MSVSNARRLLAEAEREHQRIRRHLLVAAALREVLHEEPIVVGGTAEEYWTADEYHQTDLDLCTPLTSEDEAAIDRLGFRRVGRHWERPRLPVVFEVPDDRIDGDEGRTVLVRVGSGFARVIGLDDLYCDRLRQATVTAREGVEFHSALAVVAARYEEIDWPYIRRRLAQITRTEGSLGLTMKRLDSRIRRRVRRALSTPE